MQEGEGGGEGGGGGWRREGVADECERLAHGGCGVGDCIYDCALLLLLLRVEWSGAVEGFADLCRGEPDHDINHDFLRQSLPETRFPEEILVGVRFAAEDDNVAFLGAGHVVVD